MHNSKGSARYLVNLNPVNLGPEFLLNNLNPRPNIQNYGTSIIILRLTIAITTTHVLCTILNRLYVSKYFSFFRLCLSCSSSQESFTHCPPETHSFPLVLLSSHCWLQVSVTYLPRLDEIPALLLPSRPSLLDENNENVCFTTPLDKYESSGRLHLPVVDQVPSQDEDNVTTNSSFSNHFASDNISHKTSKLLFSKIDELVMPTSKSNASLGSREVFPFSPPTPSPLSPKLLSGLPWSRKLSHDHQSQTETEENEENGASACIPPSLFSSLSNSSPTSEHNGIVRRAAVASRSSSSSSRCCSVRPPGASSPVSITMYTHVSPVHVFRQEYIIPYREYPTPNTCTCTTVQTLLGK